MNELGKFKDWLEENLTDLKQRCPARQQEFNDLYRKVILAYEESLNASLANTAEVQALTAQLATIQEDATRAMERNEDIAGIIDKINTGVGIATKIAGFLIKP